MKKHKIVVLGAGFAGVYAARNLARKLQDKVEIVVVDVRNYFLFTPLLHEVAAATVSDKVVSESLMTLLDFDCVKWKIGKVEEIVFAEKKIICDSFSLKYDYLVLALGASVNTFGIKGVDENAYKLKNLKDAVELKNALIDLLQKASNIEDIEVRKKLLKINIIGAGPTGLELAGEIADFIDDISTSKLKNINKSEFSLNIINSSEKLLPHNNSKLSLWVKNYLMDSGWNFLVNKKVVEVDASKIIFDDGASLDSSINIWTAGVKPNLVKFDKELSLENGRIKVDSHLRTEVEKVYALGDVASGSPMLAQVAVQQASLVAQNIKAEILGGKLLEFKFLDKGFLMSVGKWKAVGEVYGFPIKGWWVWILWHFVYFFKFISKSKKLKVLLDWLLNIFQSRDISKY